MGVQLNAQQNSDQPYVKAVEDFNYLACTRSLHIYLRPRFMWRLFGYEQKEDKIVEVLHSFTNKAKFNNFKYQILFKNLGHQRKNGNL